jgi:hypothetical protein
MKEIKRYRELLLGLVTMLVLGPALRLESADAVRYPLKVSENRRFLLDQDNQPVYLHGDTGWTLFCDVSLADAETYLENRRQKGFNTVNVMLVSAGWNHYDFSTRSFDGHLPFVKNLSGGAWDGASTDPDLGTPNDAYFAWCDRIIARASAKGIQLVIAPLWTGRSRSDWGKHILTNSQQRCFAYGQYLGKRYRERANIIWCLQGDNNPGDDKTRYQEIAKGLRSTGAEHLITAHLERQYSARDFYEDESWLTLNSTYPHVETVVAKSLRDYNRWPAMPSFMIEAWYEGEHQMIALQLRRQSYWSFCCGSAGQVFGNRPIYSFWQGWKAAMDGVGSVEQQHFKKLVDSRAWWKMSPDRDQSVVTNGGGAYPGTITAMRATDGETVIVYLPGGTVGPTVLMSQVSGGEAKAWWFNPRTGHHAHIGTYPTASGNRTFTLPDGNDWVLVLDDATKNLAAPGTTAYVGAVRPTKPPGAMSLPVNGSPNGGRPGGSNGTGGAADEVPGEAFRFELRTVDPAGPANPWTKIAGDLDGDGRDELIVGGQKGPLVWYRWPDFKKHTTAEGGWSTVSGAVGDVDGDSDADVLLGGTVWFENPGNLRATPDQPWTLHRIAEDPTHDIAAADFNGDGRLDAVTRNQSEFGAKSGNRIRVWLQQLGDRWQEQDLECPHGEGLAVADLDRDGDPDIAIGGTWFETIRAGDTVRWQAHQFAEFHRSATIAVADVNRDGHPDVALAPSELAGQHSRLSWFEAPADPRTPSWREHRLADPIEAVVHSLAAADFDRDGRMDIAFAEMHQGADPDEVGIFLNRGAGYPWEKVVVSTTGSHGLQVLDVDGDGAPDLFGANWSGPRQSVRLWHNRAGSPGRVPAGGATPAGDLRKAPRGQSIAWPLKVSRNGRYLVDQGEQPFLLVGDSPWSLMVEPTPAQAERYLDDRKAKGFNALLVNLLEHKFSTQPPKLRDGTPPFATPGDFDTPNEAYFRYAEHVVRQAGERGLAVLLCPAYLGYGGGDDGFFQDMLRNGPEKIRAYGRAVGRRFRSHPNLLWIVGGDFTPPPEQRWTVDELAAGLKEEDPAHLITVHYGPNTAAAAIYGDRSWLQLNSVYDYREDLYVPCLEQDARSPRLPYFLLETAYEGEHKASAARIRRQAYWPLLCGAFGVLYGNSPVWHFGSRGVYDRGGDWVAALDSRGARDMARLVAAFRERPWWQLRPDRDRRLVTAGGGAFGQLDYVTATRSEDGTLGLAYVPSTGGNRRELTVDLRLFKGPVTARWFNPTDGRYTAIGGSPFDNRQPQRLTTPGDNGTGDNDWLLIMDCVGE